MIEMIKNPVPWPKGAQVAVAITFDIDADSILHLAHPDKSHQLVAAQSLLRYDRISVPRILDMFRTMVNVLSDSVGSVIVAKLQGEDVLTGAETTENG